MEPGRVAATMSSGDRVRFDMSTVTKNERPASLDWLEEEPPVQEPFDRSYWLTHCEGFRVDFPGGAHGYVEEVRHASDPDRAALLTVRMGALGRRALIVPVDEIAFLVPRAERIWLKSPAEIAGTEAAPRSATHR
jgi:hypothetical protein